MHSRDEEDEDQGRQSVSQSVSQSLTVQQERLAYSCLVNPLAGDYMLPPTRFDLLSDGTKICTGAVGKQEKNIMAATQQVSPPLLFAPACGTSLSSQPWASILSHIVCLIIIHGVVLVISHVSASDPRPPPHGAP